MLKRNLIFILILLLATAHPAGAIKYKGDIDSDSITLFGETRTAWPVDDTNFIVNPDGYITQRGTSFTLATTPSNADLNNIFDRWSVLAEAADAADFSRDIAVSTHPFGSPSDMTMIAQTANTQWGLYQAIENPASTALAQTTVSLSFTATTLSSQIANMRAAVLCTTGSLNAVGDPISVWGQDGTAPTFSAGFTQIGITGQLALGNLYQTYELNNLTVTASCIHVVVVFWVDDGTITVGDTLRIAQVRLARGRKASPYVVRPEEVERAQASRFFDRIRTPTGGGTRLGVGQASSATTGQVVIEYPSIKRCATPTISFSSVTDFAVLNPAITVTSATSAVTVQKAGEKTVALNITFATTGGAAGDALQFSDNNLTTAFIDVDCEIQGN